MPLETPVLCKRIPTPPWGDPADRRLVDYDGYVACGGYSGLTKALAMEPGRWWMSLRPANCEGEGGPVSPRG